MWWKRPRAPAWSSVTGHVVALVVDGEPAAGEAAAVEPDLLGHPVPSAPVMKSRNAETSVGEQVEVVEPAHRRAAAMIALGDVLERRPLELGRLVFPGLVIELEDMPVGAREAVGGPVAHVAIGPADAAAHGLDSGDAAFQRGLRRRAVADMGHARRVGGGELERVELVVVPGAQVDGLALAAALGQAVDVDEEIEARLRLVGQQFQVAEVSHVEAGLMRHGSPSLGLPTTPSAGCASPRRRFRAHRGSTARARP
jgi:hypothetical protein